MRSFRIVLLAVVALLALASTGYVQTSKYMERTYEVPYDTAWRAMVTTLTDKNYKIVEQKKQAGRLSTEQLMVIEKDSVLDFMTQFGDPPFIPSADWKWGQLQVEGRLIQVDTIVTVKWKVQPRMYDQYTTTKWHYFDSNGKVETELFAEVEKKLGKD